MAKRLTFHPSLFLGEGIAGRDLEKIKKQLEKKLFFCNVYLVTPATNPNDMLEFYHSRQLKQKYYENHPPLVIGITRTYGEAVLMVQKLVQECLDKRGDCALREYLLC